MSLQTRGSSHTLRATEFADSSYLVLAGPSSGPLIWVIPGPLGLLAHGASNASPVVSGRVHFLLAAGAGGNIPMSFSLTHTLRGGWHSKPFAPVALHLSPLHPSVAELVLLLADPH